MQGKQWLETILQGGIPDAPPHFELVFQIEKQVFGMDRALLREENFATETKFKAAIERHELDLRHRLIDQMDWAAVEAPFYIPQLDRLKMITRCKREFGDKALIFSFNGDGVFWMPTGSGFMDFTLRLYNDPEGLHAEARRKCEESKLLARQQIDHGVDFIIMNSDFGYNSGPFISPEQFRDLVQPYFIEIVQTIHECGTRVILHSDGNLRLILDQIFETGVDGYQSIDPQGSMDIREVREQYPDWILMGNVPCNRLQSPEEEPIREAVRYCMTHGGIGKRYIFSTSNCIFDGMPPESYATMLDEYRRLVREHLAARPAAV